MNEAGVSGPPCPTYFETLPDDVHVRLIELLDTVRYENSENEQPLDMAVSTRDGRGFLSFLVSEAGPFYNAVSSVLWSIALQPERDSTDVSIEGGWIDFGPELFEGEELKRGLLERVLKVCGESTKEIMIAVCDDHLLHSGNGENRIVRQFLSLVVQYCPAVERLELDLAFLKEETVSSLFTTFSSQLRSIVLVGREPDYITYVPDLTSCTQIRHMTIPATPQLMSLLERTGSVLESLFLTFFTFERYGEVLDAIERNCRKLIHICLPDSISFINSVGEKRYAAFLCSYGTQLITAQIGEMVESEHLAEVFKKCSNLEVDFETVGGFGIEKWERIRVFGPRIRMLMVDVGACTGEESCSAISSCTSLSKLSMCRFDDLALEQDIIDLAIISTLSSLATPSLKHLAISEFRATEENVATIVAATSNLIRIDLDLVKPVENGTIFQAIVDSNPHLREVRIDEDIIKDGERDEDSAIELLRILVRTFSKCRSLAFGILNTGEHKVHEETIRDICGSLPCRGSDVFVRIGSTFYEQTYRFGRGFLVHL